MELLPESFSLLSQNRNESAISVEREHLALHFPLIGSHLPDRIDRSFDDAERTVRGDCASSLNFSRRLLCAIGCYD